MEWFVDILVEYGPVGFVFGMGGLALWLWAVMGRLDQHERECSAHRAAMRAVDEGIHKDLGLLRTDMVERTTKLDGKVDTAIAILGRLEESGQNGGCGRKKTGRKRTTSSRQSKATKRRKR